jgi:hypothetical protein
MAFFDARTVDHVRGHGRRLIGALAVAVLLGGSGVVLGAGVAGAAGPGSVSGVSVSLSTTAAGATEVDYTAGFTTSSTGALTANTGTITISTSGPTEFVDSCNYTVTDTTTAASSTACPTSVPSSTVTLTAPINVHHGDRVTVQAIEVASSPSTGSQTLTVSTSADLAGTTNFSLVAASPVSGVSVSLSTLAAGATEVDYTAGFTTSPSTGALDSNNGTITLSTSGSTVFVDSCNYTLDDVTSNQSTTTCPTEVPGSSVTLSAGGLNIRAGDTVHVTAVQVANAPTTGSQTFTISTSSDTAATTSFSLVAAGSVSGVSVSLSTTAAGASEVDYTAAFTTSSSTGALDSNNGTITLSTSGSTVFVDSCNYTLDDVTSNQSTTTCPTEAPGSSVTLSAGGLNIRAGDTVHVTAVQVANALTTGSQTFTVSTSSDLSSDAPFSLVAASPVTGVSVKLSVTTVSLKSKYTVSFTSSATGALDPNNGTITFVGPSGTVFPNTCTYTVTDVTTSSTSTACPQVETNGVVITDPGLNIRAGDKVTVVVGKVKNAKATGKKNLTVSTSSDLAGKGKFTLT